MFLFDTVVKFPPSPEKEFTSYILCTVPHKSVAAFNKEFCLFKLLGMRYCLWGYWIRLNAGQVWSEKELRVLSRGFMIWFATPRQNSVGDFQRLCFILLIVEYSDRNVLIFTYTSVLYKYLNLIKWIN